MVINDSLPETSLTSITVVTSCLIDHDDFLISGLLQTVPALTYWQTSIFVVMSNYMGDLACVSVLSLLFQLSARLWSHPSATVRHRCDPEQSRKPLYLTSTLMGRHYRFELSTFWDKVLLVIALANSFFPFRALRGGMRHCKGLGCFQTRLND